MYEYRAKVLRVIDGDTLHLAIDMGLETTRLLKVRLNRINCPELNTPEGQNAKAYTQAWVETYVDADDRLIIRTVKDKQEKYGRYLADVYDGPTGRICMNDAIVSMRYAEYKEY